MYVGSHILPLSLDVGRQSVTQQMNPCSRKQPRQTKIPANGCEVESERLLWRVQRRGTTNYQRAAISNLYDIPFPDIIFPPVLRKCLLLCALWFMWEPNKRIWANPP